METWNNIEGYEGLYQVSSWGRVKNSRSGRVLKAGKNNDGYLRVNLCKHGNVKQYYIHRLVAKTFIPNPQNKPQVNHIDEDKENNRVENLEWCTVRANLNHGTYNSRMSKTKSKPIICIETGIEYSSGKECARQMGLNRGNIASVLKGRYKTTGGYTFKYKEVI